jgi:hypothetical protein
MSLPLAPPERRRSHFFRRTAPVVTVFISNLALIRIPTHGARIFVKVKHGRLASACTPSVDITDNSAEWKTPLRLNYRMVPALSRSKPNLLRFSFRLEDPSGRGYTRYGIVEQDLALIPRDESSFLVTPLHDCHYNTEFRCTLYIPDKTAVQLPEERTAQPEAAVPRQIAKARSAPAIPPALEDQLPPSDSDPLELPAGVTEERLDALARQVDEIWSDVVGQIDSELL